MSDVFAQITIERPNLPAIPGSPPSSLLVIEDADSLEFAQQFAVEAKTKQVQYTKQRDELRAGALKTVEGINALFKPVIDHFASEETAAKRAISSYLVKQREEAQRRQALADAEAAKERERLAARAERAEASGKEEKAATLRNQADLVAAPVVAETKVKGRRVDYKVSITDEAAALRFIAQHIEQFSALLSINSTQVKALAKATKGKLSIPGITVTEDIVVPTYTKAGIGPNPF